MGQQLKHDSIYVQSNNIIVKVVLRLFDGTAVGVRDWIIANLRLKNERSYGTASNAKFSVIVFISCYAYRQLL